MTVFNLARRANGKSVFLAAALLSGLSGVAEANLVAGSTLSFTGNFKLEVAPSFFVTTAISDNNGIIIGTAQDAAGSHPGVVDGSETPGIDNAWTLFSSAGMHQSTSPINVLTDDGNGNVTLDFSGWSWDWDGSSNVALGGGAPAIVTCANSCGETDTFTLSYNATLPASSSLGALPYQLSLSGVVSAPVPVPAALWLLGSGLAGLAGFTRRRRA